VQGSSKLGVQGCSRVFKRSSMVLIFEKKTQNN
jgi:hypothetical protein